MNWKIVLNFKSDVEAREGEIGHHWSRVIMSDHDIGVSIPINTRKVAYRSRSCNSQCNSKGCIFLQCRGELPFPSASRTRCHKHNNPRCTGTSEVYFDHRVRQNRCFCWQERSAGRNLPSTLKRWGMKHPHGIWSKFTGCWRYKLHCSLDSRPWILASNPKETRYSTQEASKRVVCNWQLTVRP